MSGIELCSSGSTDTGRIRKVNEDDFLADTQLSLFAVADGLGGHGSGNVASSLTIETLQDEIQLGIQSLEYSNRNDGNCLSSIINDAISTTNKTIYKKNREKGCNDGAGMGTTLVGIYFYNNNRNFVSFNIGDSRLYRHKDGTLEQLTKDHSLLQEWHDNGQSGKPPPANLLMRAIGLFPEITADLILHTTRTEELLMLCSDGLTALVNDTIINKTLLKLEKNSPADICCSLIESANSKGGEDNITVVTVKT